jgi:hypothetical protein
MLFSLVWILECRLAWPEVVNVLSHPNRSRKRQGYRFSPVSGLTTGAVGPGMGVVTESGREVVGLRSGSWGETERRSGVPATELWCECV